MRGHPGHGQEFRKERKKARSNDRRNRNPYSTKLAGDRSRLFQCVELGQNLSAVAERIHSQESFRNPPVGIDQKRVSRRELYDCKVVQRSVGVGHFVIGVGQQLETQALFCAELLV